MVEGLCVRAGEDVELEAKIEGKPAPKVTWAFKGQDLRENELVKFKQTHNIAIIMVKDVSLAQAGAYTITCSNHYGTKSTDINLKVLDRPESCEGPIEINDVTSDRVRLAWKEPVNNGGSAVTKYVVEKRESSRL